MRLFCRFQKHSLCNREIHCIVHAVTVEIRTVRRINCLGIDAEQHFMHQINICFIEYTVVVDITARIRFFLRKHSIFHCAGLSAVCSQSDELPRYTGQLIEIKDYIIGGGYCETGLFPAALRDPCGYIDTLVKCKIKRCIAGNSQNCIVFQISLGITCRYDALCALELIRQLRIGKIAVTENRIADLRIYVSIPATPQRT